MGNKYSCFLATAVYLCVAPENGQRCLKIRCLLAGKNGARLFLPSYRMNVRSNMIDTAVGE